MRIFGTILAGGAGLRMGSDKALMPLAGRPLVAWVAERFAPQVEELALSANGDPTRFARLGLPEGLTILPDRMAGDTPSANVQLNTRNPPRLPHMSPPTLSKGPLSGILAGLIWAAPLGATALVVVPCDGPFLPPDLVPRLCMAAEGGVPALATSGTDVHPTYSLWPILLLPALQAFLASDAVPRVRDFAMGHGAALATFPPGSFTNANTPQDLARLEALFAAQQ